MNLILKFTGAVALASVATMAVSCSDDDGSNVPPKGSMGGSAGSGMSGSAGSGDSAGSGGSSGAAMSGSGGTGATGGSGGGTGGSGGSAGCTPVSPDAGAEDGGVGDASTDGGNTGAVSFAADIHPIFVSNCGPCHVSQNSGGHNVGDADVDAAYEDAVREAANVLERTNGQGMPPSYADPPNNCAEGDGPGDPGCLTVEETALIQTWVAQCYPR